MEEETEELRPPHPIEDSRKIISIAAGEAHTLALTGDGKVYAWGRGTFGRLGTGSEDDQHLPVRVRFFGGEDDETEAKLHIIGIAAGAYHSLALADDGSIWGWGYNVFLDPEMDGQISANGENCTTPHLLECFFGLGSPGSSTIDDEVNNGKPLKISSVKAGGMMSLAIDNQRSLWIWGNCPNPSDTKPHETEFSLVSNVVPTPLWDFHGHTVVKVACGNEHVIALVSAGETHEGGDLICYSWGGNNHGQLGLGDKESRSTPQVIETFDIESPWEVYEIACGAFHTAMLTHKKRPSDTLKSTCWTFGSGENGQLGHGTTQSLQTPEIVKGLPENVFLLSVDCGLFHTSVVSSSGELWSWGMENGLGLCPDARFAGNDTGDALLPVQYSYNGSRDRKFPEPLQVTCGAAHTVLVGDSGYKLWSWGRGRSGVLGNGQTIDCYEPTRVLWPLLDLDFEEIPSNKAGPSDNDGDKNDSVETDIKLSDAMEEMKLIRSRLVIMERYAGLLHTAIFGKPFQSHEIPTSIENSDSFDIAREWESMLESSDNNKLRRLEMFYRDMLSGVKDKLMKRKIQEIVNECLRSNARSKNPE